MKKFIVCGAGDFADIITDMIENVLDREVACYALDDEYYNISVYNEKPTVPLSEILNKFPPEKYSAVIGFIGQDMYNSKERVFNLLSKMGYDLENLIHKSSTISSNNIGKGNIILENCVIGYGVKMGNGNIMWPLSAINHHNIVGSFNNFSPCSSTSGNVIIGSHCFLGNNSTYKNKVKIADYTLIGAGAYISHDTEPYDVYVPQQSVLLPNKKSTSFRF